MNAKKVYCRDCKHEEERHFITTSFGVPVREVVYFCGLTTYASAEVGTKCSTKNVNGDCQDYSRKWWKLWR